MRSAQRHLLALAMRQNNFSSQLSKCAPQLLAVNALATTSEARNRSHKLELLALGSLGLLTAGLGVAQTAHAKQADGTTASTKELPTYSKEEVAKHRSKKDRIWVTYKVLLMLHGCVDAMKSEMYSNTSMLVYIPMHFSQVNKRFAHLPRTMFTTSPTSSSCTQAERRKSCSQLVDQLSPSGPCISSIRNPKSRS